MKREEPNLNPKLLIPDAGRDWKEFLSIKPFGSFGIWFWVNLALYTLDKSCQYYYHFHFNFNHFNNISRINYIIT